MMAPLLYAIVVPIAAGLLCFVTPARARRVRERLTILVMAASAVWAVHLFTSTVPAVQMHWLTLGSDLSLDLDFESGAFARLTLVVVSVFGLLAALYSVPLLAEHPRHKEYYAYYLLALGSTSAAVLAGNLILMLFFWELHGFLLYLMAGLHGTRAAPAATRTLLLSGLGDLALLLALGLIWMQTGSLSIPDLTSGAMSGDTPLGHVAFVLIMVGAFVKIGLMPLHSWITSISTETPMTVMAYFTSLDKMLGFYLVMLASFAIFDLGAWRGWLLMAMGAISLLGGVLMAMVQSDYRKMLAFHSVSQMGYAILGIGTATPLGIIGGLFHLLNMVIVKGALYLCGGSVQRATGRSEFAALGGLARLMPRTYIATLVVALAIAGVPPLNAFVSKWLIYQGILERGGPAFPVFLVVAMFGSALTLASFMKLLYSMFWGQLPDHLENVKESPWLMTIPLAVLALLAVGFGVIYSWPVNHLIAPVGSTTVQPIGLWQSGLATTLIVVSLLAGLVIYLAGRRRTDPVDVFYGGEALASEPYRVPGTHFYGPVKAMRGLKEMYAAAEEGRLDVYLAVSRQVTRASEWAYRYIDQALTDFYQQIIPAFWSLIGQLLGVLNRGMVLTRILWILYAGSLVAVLGFRGNDQVLTVVRVIACAGMLGWAFLAWVERRLEPMLILAGSSQFGFVVLAASLSWNVALSYLVTSSVAMAALFLLTRYMQSRLKTDQIQQMGGMAGKMPLVFFLFVIASLWLAGLPPFGSFFSKFLLGVAAGEISPLLSVVITGTAILTLSYLLRPIGQFLRTT